MLSTVRDGYYPPHFRAQLEHGSPKDARFFLSGHMGHAPDTRSIMVNWLLEKLR